MEIPSFILIEQTQQKFGYHPACLSTGSGKNVLVLCKSCNQIRNVQFRNALKFTTGYCNPCNGTKNGSGRKLNVTHYEIFIEMVNSQDPTSNECMSWNINKPHKRGFGVFRDAQKNKTYFPHIEALKIKLGRDIKDGYICQQICNNKLCFKLSHLEEVTWSQNLESKTGKKLEKPTMFASILIQETIDEFGYSPENLSMGSCRLILVKCTDCQEIRKIRASRAFSSETQLCGKCSARQNGKDSASKVAEFNLNKANEHIGEKYGFITIKSFFSKMGPDGCKDMMAIGICDCGNTVEARFSDLKRENHTISCGKCDSNPNRGLNKIMIISQRRTERLIEKLQIEYKFEFRNKSYKVTPIRKATEKDLLNYNKFKKHSHYIMKGCYCDENKEWIVNLTSFLNGGTKSCGCIWKEHLSNPIYIYAIRYFKLDNAKVTFRSGPELVFALALDKAKIDYEYEPKDKTEVTFNNQETIYIPDFRIDNGLYEVKYNRERLRQPESIEKFFTYLEQHNLNGKIIDKQELGQFLTIPLYKFCRLLYKGIKPNKNDVYLVDLRKDTERLDLLKSFIKIDALKEILKLNQ